MANLASASRHMGPYSLALLGIGFIISLAGIALAIWEKNYSHSCIIILTYLAVAVVLIIRAENRVREQRRQKQFSQLEKAISKMNKDLGKQSDLTTQAIRTLRDNSIPHDTKTTSGLNEQLSPEYYSFLATTSSRFTWIVHTLRTVSERLYQLEQQLPQSHLPESLEENNEHTSHHILGSVNLPISNGEAFPHATEDHAITDTHRGDSFSTAHTSFSFRD